MNGRLLPYTILAGCLAISSCKKKDSPQPEPAPAPNPDELTQQTSEYVKFTLGGTSYSFTPPQNGTWSSMSSSILQGNAPEPSIASFYISYYAGAGNIVFSLTRNDSTRETGNTPSSTSFVNAFKEGNYNYSSGYFDLNKRLGVSLSFKDSQSTFWYTSNPNNSSIGYQGGATFNIVKRLTWSDNFTHNKIKATMSCKVYNQSGDSSQITNGEVIISFIK